MIRRIPRAAVITILMLTIMFAPLIAVDRSDALPEGYPVYISGGYAVEQPNSTMYIDYLQPGSAENYLVHVFNDGSEQIRYRVSIEEVVSVEGSVDDWLVFLGTGGVEALIDLDPGKGKAVDLNMKIPKVGTADITVTVRDEASEEEWPLTLRIICQEGPLVVSVPGTNFILGRDTPAVFEATLKNIGNTILNVSLDFEGIVTSQSRIEDTWTVIFSERVLFVPPGQTRKVTTSIWAPELEPIGSQKVSKFSAKVVGITRPFTSGSLSFKVQTIYDLRSSVSPMDYQRIAPGGSAEFTITIENWAVDYDTVTLSVFEKPAGWDVIFNVSEDIDPTSIPFNIDPEGKRSFRPAIYTPRNAVAGRHDVILWAQGRTNLTEIRLRVEVARQDQFILSTQTPSGSDDTYRLTVGETLIPIKVVNKGNYYDNITMEIETHPEWAALTFHSVKVGGGNNVTTSQATAGINISNQFDRTFIFQEDPITTLTLSFDPSQTATVYIKTTIPLGANANSGVIGIKFRYGVFQEQQFLQAAIKLILADIEVLDLDGDGGADLDIYPLPDYDIGDRIWFSWSLKNNYPYETSGLKWSIQLSGTVLIEGTVPPIASGEVMDFNESWKVDKSTKYYHVAKLVISGDAYPSEERSPTASTDEKLFIRSPESQPPYGLMFLFGGIMLLVIVGFVAFFLWVQRDLKEKEAVERERYESLYGPGPRQALRGTTREPDGERKARSLSPGKKPELPSPQGVEGMKDRRERPRKGLKEKASEEGNKGGKKNASSLGDLDIGGGPPSRKGKRRSPGMSGPKPEKELEEMEVLEEMEEI